MRRLTGEVRRLVLGPRDESGATLVFITIALLGLLAMTAYAIDFGRIWQERRELQNGATAAALAIAEDCARGLCDLSYDEYLVGEFYADANATDDAAWVPQIDLDLAGQTVHVVTATEDESGDNTFDMLFARIVGFNGLTVGADATVAWGPPGGLATIPIIISECEWNHGPSDDPQWPGWPDGGLALYEQIPDPESDEPFATILFHDGNTTEDCNAVAGQDWDGNDRLSGGFGWLDTAGNCAAQVYESWVNDDPGSSPSTGCDPDQLKGILLGDEPVFIPYFDDIEGVGAGGRYRVVDYGAFYVIGYNFGGQYKEVREWGPTVTDPPLTAPPCRGDERCLAGWFVEWVSHDGDIDPGGAGRGVTVIKLVG